LCRESRERNSKRTSIGKFVFFSLERFQKKGSVHVDFGLLPPEISPGRFELELTNLISLLGRFFQNSLKAEIQEVVVPEMPEGVQEAFMDRPAGLSTLSKEFRIMKAHIPQPVSLLLKLC